MPTPIRSTRRVSARARGGLPALTFLLLLCVLPASGRAAPIFVNNPSFEILPPAGLPSGCGAGCSFSEDSIPGWRNTPFSGLGLSSGQFRPGTDVGDTAYFNALSDGPTSAYVSNGCIEQTVGATVQPGVAYTLQADVGWRNDAGPAGYPRIHVGNNFYDGAGTAVRGRWATFTATYVGRTEDAGLPIAICLSSVSFQGNFDRVQLSDSISVTGVESLSEPPVLELATAPNPFRGATRVQFALARHSAVDLRIVDVAGRAVRTLLHRTSLEPGSHAVTWDGRNDAGAPVGSGLYFARIETEGRTRMQRVLRVR